MTYLLLESCRNKETLLTLLEAFVYDPLIDWAADKADDVERRNLELHVSLSLFASRVEEMESVLRVRTLQPCCLWVSFLLLYTGKSGQVLLCTI